jgi:nifR3 family TIM-barrel protein
MLAPMAGYTDYAMRRICRELGAEYLISEMVSAKALVYGDRKSAPLARIRADESPAAVQLFGSEPEVLAEAARLVESGIAGGVPPTAIDLNFGCPVRKITGNGEGSALMKTPRQIEAIVRAVANAVSIPVTAKLRIGWDESSRNAVECALFAEAGGAAAVCIHGRTRTQQYSGEADLAAIAEVVEALCIPVIGNGDVRDGKSALRMLRETGCAALMIGRGAVGNPFVFREIASAIDGRDFTPPTLAESLAVGLRQLRYAIEDKGEETAVLETRKSFASYLVGFRGAAALRARIHEAKTYAELEALAREILSASEL